MNILKRRIENSLVNSWTTNNQKIHGNISANPVKLHGFVDLTNPKDKGTRFDWNGPDALFTENELAFNFQDEEVNEVIF